VPLGQLPIKYLGLPLSHNYFKATDFNPLVDKYRLKIEGWMAKLLSFTGRVECVKSVLTKFLSYWVQSFRIPNSIATELESASNFIWNGKMHVWIWKSMCLPKKEGGLGLRRVHGISLAAGIKLIWRLFTTKSLWAGWMQH